MEKLYKLTDAAGQTRGATQWGEGVTHTAPGGGELCTEAWVHAYRTPEQAIFMASSYGYDGADSLLWECEGEVGIDDGTKVGCRRLTTLRRVDKPELTIEQRIEVAIRIAMTLYAEPGWVTWATRWLDGTDRSRAAVYAAAVYADAFATDAAAFATDDAAFDAAAFATDAAAFATDAAAFATDAFDAAAFDAAAFADAAFAAAHAKGKGLINLCGILATICKR